MILEDLEARGLLADCTDKETLGRLLDSEKITFYAGYDPTAESLHAGNLVPISVATRLARAGHQMIALVGGATGVVGDPSGKSAERKLLDKETLARNLAAIRAQINRFVSADAIVVDNGDWFAGIGYLDFLRDVGKHITVNYMLAKESVRARLEDRDQGISYTEFSYMLLQGYDYVHLAKTHNCRLQIGGGDQWGNITCGIELHRKMGRPGVLHGLTSPLLLTAAGKKFGKSEAGTAVWLDANRTSPYDFYQYWVNADDADVGKYLKMFTFLPLAEIDTVLAEHDVDRARRVAQKRLAIEVTAWVHGAAAAEAARAETAKRFGGGEAPGEPDSRHPRARLEPGLGLIDFLAEVGLAESKSAARRLVQQGGCYVNGTRIDDIARTLTAADLKGDLIDLRAGKKKVHLARFE
jgi:tyrosyl-tRNA synthetase